MLTILFYFSVTYSSWGRVPCGGYNDGIAQCQSSLPHLNNTICLFLIQLTCFTVKMMRPLDDGEVGKNRQYDYTIVQVLEVVVGCVNC